MRFRLVQKSSTLNCCKLEFCAASHFWEPTAAKRMKIDPYYRRKMYPNDSSFPLDYIRRMRIFAGVPLGGGVKWQWGCRRRQFLAIWVTTSSEMLEIRPAILHGDMLPFVGL